MSKCAGVPLQIIELAGCLVMVGGVQVITPGARVASVTDAGVLPAGRV
jgi:hypothetical protein